MKESGHSSIDKALEVCEALSAAPGGMSLTDLSRALKQPRPTVHRLLAVLRRRGYVRQEESSQRYCLTFKMLDLCFRTLGRSELRLNAYGVLRDYVRRFGLRGFVAAPATGEVTYAWSTGEELAMRTIYGNRMPPHCMTHLEGQGGRRQLNCLQLRPTDDIATADRKVRRFGPLPAGIGQRLWCTCAPVHDYSGREVARVGVFWHGPDEDSLPEENCRLARDMSRQVSVRLGCLSADAARIV
jgi:DNA-binding transcriptional ArsR family regulator